MFAFARLGSSDIFRSISCFVVVVVVVVIVVVVVVAGVVVVVFVKTSCF